MDQESRREKFVRIAEKRTNAVILRIRTLSKVANPYAYDYTDDDVRKIFAAIEKELKNARARFEQNQTLDEGEFRLE